MSNHVPEHTRALFDTLGVPGFGRALFVFGE